jgi:hypothetical protein
LWKHTFLGSALPETLPSYAKMSGLKSLPATKPFEEVYKVCSARRLPVSGPKYLRGEDGDWRE